tara:strand:+ start:117 stop:275 length:159 start_codon:yes stop_codon:yes gene_type:complete
VIRLILYTKGYILWDSFGANRDLLDISQSKYRRQIGKSEKNDLGVASSGKAI